MGIELVVLDFDGTLTDVDIEVIPAIAGWKEDVRKDLGLKSSELNSRWSAAESKIRSNPTRYGWTMNGKIVAPAYADSLVMARVISGILFDEADKYMNEDEREEVLQNRLFKENYRKATTAFKDGTDEFLTALTNQFKVYIVTNSGTEAVELKLAQLPTDHHIPIHGDAKKYVLDPRANLPEAVQKGGFGRPLFLQRQQYLDRLQEIVGETPLEQVAVVGDIYELDLLLPEHLGMRTILTPRPNTPGFEIHAVRSYPNGHVANNLREVLEHLTRYS